MSLALWLGTQVQALLRGELDGRTIALVLPRPYFTKWLSDRTIGRNMAGMRLILAAWMWVAVRGEGGEDPEPITFKVVCEWKDGTERAARHRPARLLEADEDGGRSIRMPPGSDKV